MSTDKCVICLDETALDDPVISKAEYFGCSCRECQFHEVCFQRWLTTRARVVCPICLRTNLVSNTIVIISTEDGDNCSESCRYARVIVQSLLLVAVLMVLTFGDLDCMAVPLSIACMASYVACLLTSIFFWSLSDRFCRHRPMFVCGVILIILVLVYATAFVLTIIEFCVSWYGCSLMFGVSLLFCITQILVLCSAPVI